MESDAHDGRPDHVLGLFQGRIRFLDGPGYMFPDVGYLQKIRIDSGLLAGFTKCGLMHARRAGCDDDPVQAQLLDVLLDLILARFGTHEPVIPCNGDVREIFRVFGELFDLNLTGNVCPAVANINPYFYSHFPLTSKTNSPRLNWPGGFALGSDISQTKSALSKSPFVTICYNSVMKLILSKFWIHFKLSDLFPCGTLQSLGNA